MGLKQRILDFIGDRKGVPRCEHCGHSLYKKAFYLKYINENEVKVLCKDCFIAVRAYESNLEKMFLELDKPVHADYCPKCDMLVIFRKRTKDRDWRREFVDAVCSECGYEIYLGVREKPKYRGKCEVCFKNEPSEIVYDDYLVPTSAGWGWNSSKFRVCKKCWENYVLNPIRMLINKFSGRIAKFDVNTRETFVVATFRDIFTMLENLNPLLVSVSFSKYSSDKTTKKECIKVVAFGNTTVKIILPLRDYLIAISQAINNLPYWVD